MPAVEKLTGSVAEEPVTATVPSEVAPSKNWIVPVGEPKTGRDMMVAVRLVDWPTSDGLMELVRVTPGCVADDLGERGGAALGGGGAGVGGGDGVGCRLRRRLSGMSGGATVGRRGGSEVGCADRVCRCCRS